MGLFSKKQYQSSPKTRKKSVLFGLVIAATVIMIILAVMASIRVTQYGIYKDQTFRYQVKYPTHWRVIDRPQGGALVSFIAPKVTQMDIFVPNINITTQTLSGGLYNFDLFSKEAVRQITDAFEEMLVVLESEKTSIGGRMAYRFTYRGQMPEIKDSIQYSHVWFVIDNRAFIITYAAQESNFSKNLGIFNAVVNSFSTY